MSRRSATLGPTVRTGLVLNGLLVILAALLFDPLLGQPFSLGVVQQLLIAAGVVLIAIAVVVPPEKFPSGPGKSALPLPVFFFVLVIAEVTFRLVGYDFGREMERLQKVPIYYRQPRVADGEIYFRRAGPAEWSGDVLANGTHVTVTYDSLGFRNPPDLVDWDIVVVGDSFVELGYLAWDDLYTTAIGDQLGLSVKNLGVSHVGPLTYSFYLSKYGKAPSTKEAVCVFFEGNDLDDLEREERDLARYRETGERPVRKIERTTSLVKAMSVLVNRTVNRVIRVDPAAIRETQTYNAFFVSAAKSVAIEVGPQRTYGPSADQIMALDRALARWAATSRSLGLRPWLAYMPSRRRVLNGHLRFEEGVSPDVRNYEPSTMPATVGALCGKNGIRFVDLAPRLRAAADGGVLPYNEADAHLNLAGCAVVATALAEALETRP